MALPGDTTTTITKEEVLAAYNLAHGSSYTFAELGRQLAIQELTRFRKKMLVDSIADEVVV